MSTKHTEAHGGDVDRAAREYGLNPGDILDYSANVNPLPLPEGMGRFIGKNLDLLRRYPDRDYVELREAISRYEAVPPEHILVGNGATELLYLAARALKPSRVLIPAPSFGDYERAFAGLDTAVEFFPLLEKNDFRLDVDALLAELTKGYRMTVLGNPNNPTGKLIGPENLRKILATAREEGSWVLIDETFVDFAPDPKKATAVNFLPDHDRLLIVKAFTKSFGVPGLRLGYCLANPDLIAQLQPYKEPWTVNAFASILGPWLLKQKGYLAMTREWIQEERPFFLKGLQAVEGLHVFDTEANFVLVKLTNPYWKVPGLKRSLEGIGIMIRDASTFRFLDHNYFRLAIKDRDNNLKLIGELKDLLEQYSKNSIALKG